MKLAKGKLNILIDAQFGSTGKGLIASYITNRCKTDIAITNNSPNAGHTFYDGNTKCVVKQLPVIGVLNRDTKIYLCAGSVIDPKILLKKLDFFNINHDRVSIHPRAAIITTKDIINEQQGSVKKIASTMRGVGSALSRKINRSAQLAQNCKVLQHMVRVLDLSDLLDQGCIGFMETSQGLGLALNSGLSYPHCTSREISISSVLSDAQLHPKYLGKVISSIRTYPIRVGHIIENGVVIGNSGPFYDEIVLN